ncbi:transglutaminase TgpA family protein [Stutzerimonas marianensis]|uniref:transglutaminase TgpA family protein n=1 Tax=Stutzerimonas marianensis TaxID=2929513 RepID=UPI003C2DF223
MSVVQPIPRNGLLWLLVAQVLVILPHLGHLPLWIIGLWLTCATWRVQIFRMRARYPRSWVKAAMMIGTGAGVYLSRGSLIGLDAGAVLLIAAFILKLVEMRSRRDALVLVFLGFFAVVTSYLFNDGLVAGVYSLLPVTALLAAMIGLQQSRVETHPWPTLRLAGSLMLQAVPLMLVLFVFFPRLGPLWSLPQPSDQGVTGLADSMSPGDIAQLSRSGQLAFRASFEGPVPARDALYWRAVTFERFDGRRWSQAARAPASTPPAWTPEGEPLRYSIVMQPSGRPWLYALDVPELAANQAQLMPDFQLQRGRPVDQALLYQVTSWPQAQREPVAPADTLARALQLPLGGNPRSREWAVELRRQHPEPEALVQTLLMHFNRQPYAYTLRPPAVGADIVDGFLFDTRRGFCIHYAGAMTFVLRAAGIPARVVAGYQGGELNPSGNYLSVRQLDAHAWVEYWLQGRGWVSVDPTFQVAPERIELGLEEALADEQDLFEGTPMDLRRYRQIGWLNELRFGWDSLNYGWQRWVLGYQGERQLDLLRSVFGKLDGGRLGLIMVVVGAAFVLLLAVVLLKPWKRERDPQQRLFRRFERALARRGVTRARGEGARDFAERAARALPDAAEPIRSFAHGYERLRYRGESDALPALHRSLAQLKRQLGWGRRR